VTVYPEIQGGRVIADVKVDGLGDYFVGERTLAWVSAGARRVIIVPAAFIFRRAGVNYVRTADGAEIVVQPGERHGDGIEILSGLADGDALVAP
jgi:multidrug efflux pump subunit AcrA (membrane-fusion protein)